MNQERATKLAAMYGFDVNWFITLMSKLAGPIQQIIFILMEEWKTVPQLKAMPKGDPASVDWNNNPEVKQYAANVGIDPISLINLLVSVGPILANIIWKLIKPGSDQ